MSRRHQSEPPREPLYISRDGKPWRTDVDIVIGEPTVDGENSALGLEIRGARIRFAMPVPVKAILGSNSFYYPTEAAQNWGGEEQLVLPDPAPATANLGQARKSPGGASADEDRLFEVEAIVARKLEKKRLYYEVKWVGYPDTTWEPATALRSQCPDVVKDYEADVQRKKYQEKKKTTPVRNILQKMLLARQPSATRSK